MNKQQFLQKLEAELKRNNVSDAADILEEYEQHFAFKLADGCSEEEISAKLGTPESIAKQYDAPLTTTNGSKRALTVIGLGVTEFFFGVLCTLLFAWEIIMAALVVACGLTTCGLFFNIRTSFFSLLPTMPYHCAFILGIAFLMLTVLSTTGAIYFFGFIRQLIRAFSRFRKNTLANSSGRATLPPLAIYPQFPPKKKRILRILSLIAVTVFAVCFIVGTVICMISAGSLEFWHVWKWFGYAK